MRLFHETRSNASLRVDALLLVNLLVGLFDSYSIFLRLIRLSCYFLWHAQKIVGYQDGIKSSHSALIREHSYDHRTLRLTSSYEFYASGTVK